MANISHPVGQILGCKDTAQAFLVINDQDAIRSFGGTELTCFGDGDVLRDSKSGRGTECRDSPFLCSRFSWTLLAGRETSCRDGAFASQFGLDFLANGLGGSGDISGWVR